MAAYENVGRIHKEAFLISNLVLFVLCLIATSARFYVRVCVQRQLSIDDGILLLGVLFLISAEALLFTFLGQMYVVGALENGVPVDQLPSDFIDQAFDYQKFSDIALILSWLSMVCVKYSYLFLFKRLITRVRPMVIFWWFSVALNGVVSVYGILIYILTCPIFYNLNAINCTLGSGLKRVFAYSISQIVLDIFGDLLILFIPCYLIWKIKIRWTQKIALASCLCLTILTVICSIIKVAGIHTGLSLDSVWEAYWQLVTTNVAITMTSATAFRVFFVTNGTDKSQGSSRPVAKCYNRFRQFIHSTFTSRALKTKPSADSSQDAKPDGDKVQLSLQIPRGTMTGVRTIIRGQDKTTVKPSQVPHSMLKEENEDSWPLSRQNLNVGVIGVQQDITLRHEDAC